MTGGGYVGGLVYSRVESSPKQAKPANPVTHSADHHHFPWAARAPAALRVIRAPSRDMAIFSFMAAGASLRLEA